MNDSSKIIRHNNGSVSVDYGDLVLPVPPPDFLQPPQNVGLGAFCEFMESMRDSLGVSENARDQTIPSERFEL
jgi:hypothetical protein